jgi:tetratricopeptide (TPR) repeat protein
VLTLRLAAIGPLPTNIPPMWLMFGLIGVLAVVFILILLFAGGSRRSGQETLLQTGGPAPAAALRSYALALLEVGRTADAEQAVRAHLTEVPTDVRMRAVLAVLCSADGDRPQAAAEYERTLRVALRVWEQRTAYLVPYVACLYAAYAGALQSIGRSEDAEARRQDALRLDPAVARLPQNELEHLLLEAARDDELERRAFEDLPYWEQSVALALPFGLTDGPAAVTFYRSAVSANPQNARLRGDFAQALHSVGDHNRAEREFKEALRLDQRDPWARFHFGLMYWRRQRLDDAERELTEAAQLAPRMGSILGTLGVFYLRQEHFAEAEQQLLAALSARPDIWALARLYGAVELRQGKLERAVRAFEEADRLGATDITFRVAYAELREQMGQLAAANEQYHTALRSNPSSGAARASYAGFLLRQGRLREAEEQLQQAILLPGSEPAHLHFVQLLLLERRLDEVVPHLEVSLQLEPDSGQLKEAQAEWMLLRGRASEADELTLQMVRSRTPWGTLQLVRGRALLALGRQLEAQASLREAVRLDPTLPNRLLVQARALHELGRLPAALDVLDEVIALQPERPEALAERDAISADAAARRESQRSRRTRRLPPDGPLTRD